MRDDQLSKTDMNSEFSASGLRVLVVEDEPRLAGVLRDYLVAAGYIADCVADGAGVMSAFHTFSPNLVLLDLMLPGRDGIELCRDIHRNSDVPVIIVTARVEEVDRLLGLEVGADDYICKPFSPREVVARVGTVLRRYHASVEASTEELTLNENNARFSLHGQWLDLTPVEYRLLRTLKSPPRRIWSRDLLMDHLYPDHRIVTDRTIDSHVKNLRRKLLEAGLTGEPIRSIYGIGYLLDI